MPKIQTVEWTIGPVSVGNYGFDIASQLTAKLQRMVRQCQIFKIANITISPRPTTGDGERDFVCKGQVRYLEPTQGRIAAMKNAFSTIQKWRKLQGISPNYEYDFRVGLDAGATYVETSLPTGPFGGSYPLVNQAVAYHSGVPYSLWCVDTATGGVLIDYNSIFRVYNFGLPDWTSSGDAVSQVSGWNNEAQDLAVGIDVKDYLQNETNMLVGNPWGPKAAHEQLESQSFTVAFNTEEAAVADGGQDFSLNLRGNQYLQFLNGLFEVRIRDVSGDDNTHTNAFFQVTCDVLGWKSYMKRPTRRSKKGRR